MEEAERPAERIGGGGEDRGEDWRRQAVAREDRGEDWRRQEVAKRPEERIGGGGEDRGEDWRRWGEAGRGWGLGERCLMEGRGVGEQPAACDADG